MSEVTTEALFVKETKRKYKYQAEELGISIAIYIDKQLKEIPSEIKIMIAPGK